MKILVTSQGASKESQVDARFGRAQQFVVVDTESGEAVAADNSQNLNAAQGAGIQAAQTAARLKADVVLTGNVGPKAFTTLQAAGIAVFTGVSGTVAEAVERFKANELKQTQQANVEGHWI